MATSSGLSSSGKEGKKLWIGNLESSVTEFQLLKLVSPFGKIKHFDFLYSLNEKGERSPRGYAFVTYEELSAARAAIKALDKRPIHLQKIHVKYASSTNDS